MLPFEINNEHLSKMVNLLGKEFNQIDFLFWVSAINPNFSYANDGSIHNDNKKFFHKKKNEWVVTGIPTLEIKNELEFKKIISYPHGLEREPLVQILQEYFQIDYWQEALEVCCADESGKYNTLNFQVLAHSTKNLDFTDKNIDKLKLLSEKMITSAKKSQQKRFSEVLQYLSFCIANKNLFDNDWIVGNLNSIFSEEDDGTSKQLNFIVDKISRQFIDLDFSKFKLNTGFKKLLKGKVPLKISKDCNPYFWQMDISRYAIANKVVENLLQTNCISGLEVLDRFLKNQVDVLSHFIKRDKTMITLSVLHEDNKLNEKIDFVLNEVINITSLNRVIDPRELEKSLLYLDLNEKMAVKKDKEKRIKL